MIAPIMYPGLMSMLDLPEFGPVKLQDIDLHISCTFPPENGTTPFWGQLRRVSEHGSLSARRTVGGCV
jgi:hypothetical protein